MTARAERTPWGALLGTIVFVAAVPGTLVLLVPWWLSGGHVAPPFLGTSLTRVVGAVMIVAALPLFVSFCSRFVWEGRGTPAPIAPTEHLVVGGPYRWVRNPGYVAVTAILVGEGLVFGSPFVLLFALLVALAFHVFVLLYEEPTLRATFGAEYDAYCRRVPRWLPRPPRAE
jgi:protein-S-isoprenylcysteine O-methyltransferase Ste14